MIKLTFDTKILVENFEALRSKQLPFAMALTLTRTAQVMQTAEKIEMKFAFDFPTPFTINSVFVRGATKKKLEAFVFLRDEASKGTPPVRYLAPQVYGGARRVKRFERALRAAGILGEHELAVPGSGARLNKFGNLTGGAISAMLSGVSASPDPQQNKSRRAAGKKPLRGFFSGEMRKKGGAFGDSGTRGIWERSSGRKIKPVLIFVPEASVDYRKRFDFFGIIEQVLDRGELAKQFKLAFREARRTAKKGKR